MLRINLESGNFLHEFAYAEDSVLNPQIADYVATQTRQLKHTSTLNFEITAKKDDVPAFKKALKNEFENQGAAAIKEIKAKRILAIVMFAVGALFLTTSWLLKDFEIFFEVFLVASWVFFWRMIEVWFFEISKLRYTIFKCHKILTANFNIKELP